jgi:hypothetical protein
LRALRQIPDLFLHEPVEVERSQEHELQPPGLITRRIGNLQDGRTSEPAEYRLYDDRLGCGAERPLEIVAIAQVENPPGMQGIAEQAAIGIDGHDTGKLGILLENLGKEIRTRRLVADADVTRARQTEMKLASSLDLGVEGRCNRARRGGQATDGGFDLLATILVISPAHKDGRQQSGSQYQQQKAQADGHEAHL